MRGAAPRFARVAALAAALAVSGLSCLGDSGGPAQPRLALFVGVDISGSFMRGRHFEDSLDFLARYLHGHLHGFGGFEVPKTLFVGSIGGAKPDEPKTFFPIQSFENKSITEIRQLLSEIFPKKKENPFTDFNAFFEQIAVTIRNKNLLLRPVSIVLLSDGIPDSPGMKGAQKHDAFKKIKVEPLEQLSRNVTIRLLYTNAVVGANWQTHIPRRRVKVWTQDDKVMRSWNDPKILLTDTPEDKQERFFKWTLDNVDFGVRGRRVD